jgi:hypothetical protein
MRRNYKKTRRDYPAGLYKLWRRNWLMALLKSLHATVLIFQDAQALSTWTYMYRQEHEHPTPLA